ncbi:hypothetical protein [Paenibacillus xylanilyticus]|uniref:hypothetical protein n=1 Tax=Paenibacillus xylanilyticus TaxID=248903 RepID=UPI00129E7057|nr:hypothetical protein [Paenibacillus xylanilyticus]
MEITDGIGYSQSEINLRFDHGFIVNKIMKFEANFQRDELAILLFRKKNEFLFRDKLSYLIQQDIQHYNYIVTPEWKAKKWGQCDGNPSFDVAILKEKSVEQGYHNHQYIPHTLIEIKNAYSPFILGYEASDSIWKYKNGGGLASDIKKMCDARRGHAGIVDFHAILAVNCPRKHRSEKYRFIASDTPNYTSLNKLMIGYKNDFSRIIEDLTIKLHAEAEKFNPTDISFVTLYGGQAYENEMDIVFMILSF